MDAYEYFSKNDYRECPFCGGEPTTRQIDLTKNGNPQRYQVEISCAGCGGIYQSGASQNLLIVCEAARKGWNSRLKYTIKED